MTEINQPVSPYVENFKTIEDIAREFAGSDYGTERRQAQILADLNGAIIHLAWYGYGDYSGSSFVLYEKDGKLYEVNAGHCSCNGLEGQWEPEETSIEALRIRKLDESSWYEGSAAAQTILNLFVNRKHPN